MKRLAMATALVVLGILAHGVLGLTDYVLWDGFWYHAQLALPSPVVLHGLFDAIGRPLDGLFLQLAGGLSGPRVFKWLSLIAWIAVAPLVALVLGRGGRVPTAVAWSVAALAAVVPCYDVLGDVSVWPNTLALPLFWAGMAVTATLRPLPALRCLGALLLLLSFNLNSLLVFFYALALALGILGAVAPTTDPSPQARCWMRWLATLRKRPEVPCLPLVFWGAKLWLTPASGAYADYNRPVFSIERVARAAASWWNDWFVATMGEIAALPWILMALAAAVGIAGALLVRERRRRWGGGDLPSLLQCLALGACALGLLAAAGLPYALVEQGFASGGWLTRNTILMPVPAAMAVAAVVLLANRLLMPRAPWLWPAPLLALGVLCIAASNANYLRLQALGAKQEAIHRRLSDQIDRSGAVLIQLRDLLEVAGTIPYYPPLVWSHLAAGPGKPPRAMVVETAAFYPTRITGEGPERQVVHPFLPVNAALMDRIALETTIPRILDPVARQGPQRMVVVGPGRIRLDHPVRFGAQYLWASWSHPARRDSLLEGIADFSVVELPPIGSN